MEKSSFTARRTTRTYRQTINAIPEKVFPLLCPAREAEWLDGWQYAMIYSDSGLIEEGAVFSTPHEGEENAVLVEAVAFWKKSMNYFLETGTKLTKV